MASPLPSEDSERPVSSPPPSNVLHLLIVGIPGLLLTLLFFYFFFPFGFRALLIGGPLLVVAYIFGDKQEVQHQIIPTESTPLLQKNSPKEIPQTQTPTINSKFDDKESQLPSQLTGPSVSSSLPLSPPLSEKEALVTKKETEEVKPSVPISFTCSTESSKNLSEQYTNVQIFSPGARAMAAARKAKAMPKTLSKEVVVLYGSQTGNAMEIAKSISAEATSRGIPSKAYSMDDFPFTKLPSVSIAIFVVSSTGEGDPPENCETFFNSIRRRTHSPTLLTGLQYTVLGLGDSNFTRFMSVPRVFSTRLPELGATRFYKCCEADEVEGLEDIVDEWEAGLWEPFKATFAEESTKQEVVVGALVKEIKEEEVVVELVGVPALQPCRVKLEWLEGENEVEENKTLQETEQNLPPSVSSPFMASVSRAKYMTASWSERVVIDLEVDITGSGMTYKAGDSVGVIPQNSSETVDQLVQRLGVDGNKRFRVTSLDSEGKKEALSHIKQPCSLRQAFLQYVDITAVAKKGLLRMLAEHCSDPKEKTKLLFLSSKGGKDVYKVEIQEGRPGLLDLLLLFPSCNPDLAHLFDSLPPLVSRFYSITNSSAFDPNHVQVAFSVVKMKTLNQRLFLGVATNYMEKLLAMDSSRERSQKSFPTVQLPVFVKEGGTFRSPENLEAPYIMIGPGTGVGPFRGFLQERKVKLMERGGEAEGEREGEGEGDIGDAWLFYGCRRKDEDYLYKEDLEGFEKDGTLTKLVVAFSREGNEKVYVQHKLAEHGESVYSLLKHPKAHIFVCGDGAHMAKDVHSALLSIVAQYGDMTESLATAYLGKMATEKRYVRDIWS